MLIVCPNCAKSYHIARVTIGAAGRDVQCSKCFTRWHSGAAEESGAGHGDWTPAVSEDVGAAMIEGGATSRKGADSYEATFGGVRKSPPPKAMNPAAARSAGWQLGACAGLLGLAMGGVAAREAVVLHLPQMGAAYAAIGLPVNLQGISFGPLQAKLDEAGGGVLSVEGTVTNMRARAVTVPEIVASLKGPDGREVYAWRATVPKANLGAGETTSFRTRLSTPPSNAQKIVLRFASVDEAARKVDIIQK
jgi:predicted Zn finger-like uncharacterized protein